MPAPLPKWVWSDMYDIEARAPMSNATKDEMRLMMQSLLAERFHLAAHFENQTVPVFALVLAKPGKLGPNLRPHESGPPCDTAGGNRPQDRDVFPPDCETYALTMQQTARADWVPTYNDGSAGQFHPYDGRGDAARGGPHRAFRQVRFQAGMGA